MPAMFESGVFTDGKAAWHGLGTVVDEKAINAEETLHIYGIGEWELSKLPLLAALPDGGTVPVADRWAHVRMSDRRVLGVVGNVYRSVTNEEAFSWADELVGGFGAHYKTAGSLYGGRVVWLYLEVPYTISVGDGKDKMRTGLYLTNSHDGSAPVEAAFTTTRIVCANTLALARAYGVDRVRIKHCANAEQKLAEAQRVMHLVDGARERGARLAEELFAKRITPSQVGDVLDAVYPMPKLPEDWGGDRDNLERGLKRSLSIAEDRRNAVLSIYNNGEEYGQPEFRGTAWGLYNAFSAAFQHQELLGKDADARQRKAEAIFARIMGATAPADEALKVLTAI